MFRARTKTGISPLLPLPTDQPSHGSVEEVGVVLQQRGRASTVRPSGGEEREGRRATTSSHRSLPLSLDPRERPAFPSSSSPIVLIHPASKNNARTDARTDGRTVRRLRKYFVSLARAHRS